MDRLLKSYANGEGYSEHNILGADGNITRFDLRDANMTDFKFKAPSPVPKGSESHSGADVGIFASGTYLSLLHMYCFIRKYLID